MDEFYKISSTERVEQLEKELAVRMAELKTEIEDNGVLQGIPNRSHSSVPIPKDMNYFRKAREVVLNKILQVAEAKPLVVQADVVQRELEICLRREETAESLPLLLHQYLQYLPLSHRMEVVTEKHAKRAHDNEDKFRSAIVSESLSSNIHISFCHSISGRKGPHSKAAVFTLPQHTTETEKLKPQLRHLLSHFGVCYDTESLKNSANEMELFALVIQKFRSIFSKRQTMRTFPVYEAGVPESENWGILSPSMALKKRANWIPFIQLMPIALLQDHGYTPSVD
ncbi:putative uncharacterized protein C6orf183 [Carettochelys insculpta]|uniref:putative uncharacterized protein C6orf183 n=1 Tax=Carettochelys insculpta TaxID=44489 RepID=UPI003EB94947